MIERKFAVAWVLANDHFCSLRSIDHTPEMAKRCISQAGLPGTVHATDIMTCFAFSASVGETVAHEAYQRHLASLPCLWRMATHFLNWNDRQADYEDPLPQLRRMDETDISV